MYSDGEGNLALFVLTASIGAVIGGAYAGAITIVSSQEINSGWSNIDSWNVFKETGVGLVSGAISGLGTGIGTSILTGGIFQITSGLFVVAYIVLNHALQFCLLNDSFVIIGYLISESLSKFSLCIFTAFI